MKKAIVTAVSSLLYAVITLQAQQRTYSYGLLLNDSAYDQIPRKPTLLTRSYNVLPAAYSLKPYCPSIKNQGNYDTCTGWAIAYAARTIAEAVANNWRGTDRITREAFSPTFLYSEIKEKEDANCQKGAYIQKAFETLKTKGVVKYRDFSLLCSPPVSDKLYSKALQYTIDDYFSLFSNEEDSYSKKVGTTKKSIAEGRPVVVAMRCYKSFSKDNEVVWSGILDHKKRYHALCVVAYDDNKYGGAFLLMNSWGTRWGDKGFKWVRYTDYNLYVNYAVEMYVEKKNTLAPTKSEPVDLSGEVHFVLSTGQEMHPELQTVNNNSYYKMEGSYLSGTRYRLYISNNEPAYVYVIGSDLTNSVTKVFPPNNRISAALVYQSNDIALPDEKWYIEMDNTKGTDYVCILYSHDELPIDDVVREIKAESGSFFDKVNKVLANKIVPPRVIHYDRSKINFSVKNTDKTIVPMIVEIEHQ